MLSNVILNECPGVVSFVARRVVTTVQGMAFWTAALMPIVYVLLLLIDPGRVSELSMLGKLVVVNAAALVVGHGYGTA